MIQSTIEVIFESGFQAVGWAVFKLVTLGRYEGFRNEDMVPEGAVGMATLLGVGYLLYRWL